MESTDIVPLYLPRILELSDELQVRCLKYLTAIELLRSTVVCRKWKQLGYDRLLWTEVDATPFYRSIPVEQLIQMAVAGGRFLRVANLRGCVQLTGYNLRTLADHCPNVEILSLKDCRSLSTHSIAYFLTLLQRHGKLRALDLSGLDTVRNATLVQIATLRYLEQLDLSWCCNLAVGTGEGYALQGLEAIAVGCPRITHLRLNGCASSAALDPATMATFGRSLTSLSVLSLASCTGLTDTALDALFHRRLLCRLTYLNLSGCSRLTDASLRSIGLASPPLTHLQLANCVLLTDQGFSFLATRLPLLTHLDLEDLQQITNATIKSFATHQSYLTHLCLTNCMQIGDDVVIHLVLRGAAKSRLHHLELDNSMVSDICLETIADAMAALNKKDTPLAAADVAVATVTTLEVKPELTIEVLDCRNVTEAGIRKALAKAGPVLAIKSFYSWKSNNEDDGDSAMGLTSGTASLSTRVSSGARQRRQRHAVGQPQCIIL